MEYITWLFSKAVQKKPQGLAPRWYIADHIRLPLQVPSWRSRKTSVRHNHTLIQNSSCIIYAHTYIYIYYYYYYYSYYSYYYYYAYIYIYRLGVRTVWCPISCIHIYWTNWYNACRVSTFNFTCCLEVLIQWGTSKMHLLAAWVS